MITKVGGVRVGHFTDLVGITGCTVLLCDMPMVGGVDVRGANPGTLNTDLLRPSSSMPEIFGLAIVGGSNFGLGAVSGVVSYLEDKGKGLDVGVIKLPIVSAAVIFDLAIGNPKARPTPENGYQACVDSTDGEFLRGSVGAGIGATVGKLLGMNYCTKGGIGTHSIQIRDGIIVGALVVVNAFGDVIDPANNSILCGARDPSGNGFIGSLEQMKKGQKAKSVFRFTNTTIGIVATNAQINKEEANRIASLAHNGLAKVISPVHTSVDGDTIFAIGRRNNGMRASVDLLGSVAAEVIANAVIDAVMMAKEIGGIPSSSELLQRM